MSRLSRLGAAALIGAFGAALPVAAAAQTEPQTPQAYQQQSAVTEEQILAFAAASQEIDPISRSIAEASPAEQAEAASRIRAILDQHQIDAATYNSIASQAQTDAALAARIAAAQTQMQNEQAHEGGESH